MLSYHNIHNGLLQKAKTRFQARKQDLSREKMLFLDWMAQELYEVHKMAYSARDYSTYQVLRHLHPHGFERRSPVRCLLRANPQSRKVLKPTEDVFTIGKLGGDHAGEIYFSPAFPTTVAPAKLLWRAEGNRLESLEDGFLR